MTSATYLCCLWVVLQRAKQNKQNWCKLKHTERRITSHFRLQSVVSFVCDTASEKVECDDSIVTAVPFGCSLLCWLVKIARVSLEVFLTCGNISSVPALFYWFWDDTESVLFWCDWRLNLWGIIYGFLYIVCLYFLHTASSSQNALIAVQSTSCSCFKNCCLNQVYS